MILKNKGVEKIAKVEGPLFSIDAGGKTGKAHVHMKRKGRHDVRKYIIPGNPQTDEQQEGRMFMKNAVLAWKTQGYNNIDIEGWNNYAKTKKKIKSGYNQYLTDYLYGMHGDNTWTHLFNCVISNITGTGCTVKINVASDKIGKLFIGTSKKLMDKEVSGVFDTDHYTFTINGLSFLTRYYFYIANRNNDVARTGIYTVKTTYYIIAYIYCAGTATRKVWKIQKSDMSKIGESIAYGGDIWALTEDTDYIYCAGITTNKVWKIQKSDMSKVGESIGYGDFILALAEDTDYIYCGGGTPRTVWKIQKSDMSKVGESSGYGGNIYAIAEDTDYIYCAGITTNKVRKIQKSDMSLVGESISYGGYIFALAEDTDYIYCGGATIRKVWKIQKSDMSKVGESIAYGGSIQALAEDTDYIYCAGITTNKVWKIQKSDMSKVGESIAYGGTIRALAEDTDYIYCAGITTKKVYKIQKSDMSKVSESISYGGDIYALTTI